MDSRANNGDFHLAAFGVVRLHNLHPDDRIGIQFLGLFLDSLDGLICLFGQDIGSATVLTFRKVARGIDDEAFVDNRNPGIVNYGIRGVHLNRILLKVARALPTTVILKDLSAARTKELPLNALCFDRTQFRHGS